MSGLWSAQSNASSLPLEVTSLEFEDGVRLVRSCRSFKNEGYWRADFFATGKQAGKGAQQFRQSSD